MKKRKLIFLLWLLYFPATILNAQQNKITVQHNVVYGMVSGAALLMDVYQPATPNHIGILAIPGSAYGYVYADFYGQQELKADFYLDSNYFGKWANSLLQKGYTVFVINHRFAPGFHAPEIISDCRRAVRFIRYHANEYQVNPTKIGAFGHSSGGALVALLGVSDSTIQYPMDAVDKMSAQVQAVVTLAGVFNLADFNKKEDTAGRRALDLKMLEALMGALPEVQQDTFILSGNYKSASAIAQVNHASAPMLLYYADNDPVIPPRQSVNMYQVLLENKVPAKLVLSKNTGHTPLPDMAEVDQWFQHFLNE